MGANADHRFRRPGPLSFNRTTEPPGLPREEQPVALIDRGEPAAPLAAVPIVVKAAIPAARMRSTWGLRMPASTGLSGTHPWWLARVRDEGHRSSRRPTPIRCSPGFTPTGSPRYGQTSNPRGSITAYRLEVSEHRKECPLLVFPRVVAEDLDYLPVRPRIPGHVHYETVGALDREEIDRADQAADPP